MLATYRVHARFVKKYTPFKGFPGTTIRGALGVALRRASCLKDYDDCRECPEYRSCVYARIFESSSVLRPAAREAAKRGLCGITNPYTIEDIKVQGDRLEFSVNVFGRAVELEPYLIVALVGMGTQGLGWDPAAGERRKFRVERIDRILRPAGSVTVLYTENSGFVVKPPSSSGQDLLEIFEPRAREIVGASPQRLLLFFLTPFRLVERGKATFTPKFTTVVMNLARKFSLLAAYHGAGRPFTRHDALRLKWLAAFVRLEHVMLGRRVRVVKKAISGKEKNLGTYAWVTLAYRVPGEFWAHSDALTIVKLLLLGEYVHLGKLATAGYGDYLLFYS